MKYVLAIASLLISMLSLSVFGYFVYQIVFEPRFFLLIGGVPIDPRSIAALVIFGGILFLGVVFLIAAAAIFSIKPRREN